MNSQEWSEEYPEKHIAIVEDEIDDRNKKRKEKPREIREL
jgi:hypothetical protein